MVPAVHRTRRSPRSHRYKPQVRIDSRLQEQIAVIADKTGKCKTETLERLLKLGLAVYPLFAESTLEKEFTKTLFLSAEQEERREHLRLLLLSIISEEN